jgi:CheY-like chemotaxis protein
VVAETPIRIFIADDSASDVFLVRRALQQQGIPHDLTVAHDGEEALRLLSQVSSQNESKPPQLILLDLNLPRVDGGKILSYIRRTPAFDGTVVIVLTTSESPEDLDLVRTMGALYFQKPGDLRSYMRLGQVIEDALKMNC